MRRSTKASAAHLGASSERAKTARDDQGSYESLYRRF